MPAVTTLQFRHGLAATWTSVNPVLAQGELGVETDTAKFKIGDGVTAWNSLAYQPTTAPAASTLIYNSFGDGSDGNVTISSGVTSLTRDMYYNNLTINGTGSLNPSGYKIFVAGVLDLSAAPTGAISASGLPGGNSPGLNAGAAPAAPPVAGSVGAAIRGVVGVQGGASTSTIGNNANASALSDGGNTGNGGSGGSGNAGAGNTGGVGGTATATFPIQTYTTNLIEGATLISGGMGGASGASGNGNGHYQGGGSGAGGNGGGIVAIYANIINRGTNTNVGIIQSNGGNGGNGAEYLQVAITGGGGGGSGGGGGWIYIVYNALTGSTVTNALQANGGNGGNGGNGDGRAYYWTTRTSTNNGSTWATDDSFIYGSSDASLALGAGKDASGNIYSVGYGRSTSNVIHWLVRQSTNNGVTWTTIDDFVYTGSANSQANNFGVDSLGNFYVVGLASDSSGHFHWIVRQSTDSGVTWATVDDYVYPGGTNGTKAYGIVTDLLGNVYVCGYGWDASKSHWLVRQSTNNGSTWANVDDFVYTGGVSNQAAELGIDSAGNVYGTGFGGDATPVYHWVTRQSTNNGSTWATVDDYVYPGGTYSFGASFTKDLLGNIYVAGFGCDVSTVSYRWVTRQSTDNGLTWANVDDYVYPGNTYTIADAMTVDSVGNVYAGGLGDDAVGTQRWLIRQSTNNGSTWANVDDYYLATVSAANVSGMTTDNSGNVYASGYAVGPAPTTGNGGNGGAGGNSGTIFVLQSTTSTALINVLNNNASGSAGGANSGATGGTGGTGGLAQANL